MRKMQSPFAITLADGFSGASVSAEPITWAVEGRARAIGPSSRPSNQSFVWQIGPGNLKGGIKGQEFAFHRAAREGEVVSDLSHYVQMITQQDRVSSGNFRRCYQNVAFAFITGLRDRPRLATATNARGCAKCI